MRLRKTSSSEKLQIHSVPQLHGELGRTSVSANPLLLGLNFILHFLGQAKQGDSLVCIGASLGS